jgi:hypothetical protein
MIMKNLIVKLTILLVLISLGWGCGNTLVGLGVEVDIQGPYLELTSPSFLQSVSGDLHVAGVVTDDQEVGEISLSFKNPQAESSDPGWIWSGGLWYRIEGDSRIIEEGGSDNGELRNLEFSLDIDCSSFGEGEFILCISSKDSQGNTRKESTLERTIYFDLTPPVASVSQPSLVDSYELLSDYSLGNPVVIQNLHNQQIVLSGNNQDSRQLSEMEILLLDQDGESYYDEILSQSTAQWPEDAQGTLWNWSLTISHDQLGLMEDGGRTAITERQDLQLITRVLDVGGNVETRSQGWLCYWPQADIPWITLPEDNNVYPGASLTGMAYDDDGIQSVQFTLSSVGGSTSDEETLSVQGEPGSYSWQWTAPRTVGDYSLSISAVDINNCVSEVSSYDFHIEDLESPDILWNTPDLMIPLLGDSSGDIEITGEVLDNGLVSEGILMWVKPGNEIASLLTDNELWTTLDGSFPGEDTSGNKFWQLSLSESTAQEETTLNVRTWQQDINIFNDLGISASLPLSSQTFLIMAEDEDGLVAIEKFIASGDFENPQISITQLEHLNDDDTVKTEYTLEESLNIPLLENGESLRISGSWGDNSTDHWADKTKISEFLFSCNETSYTALVNNNGTWSVQFTPAGSVLSIVAELEDLGGNSTRDEASVFIESTTPQIQRISSTVSNGAYPVDAVIDIFIEFNKPVVLSGDTLSLELNNGVTVAYLSGAGSNRLVFRYTIESGEDQSDLTVTALNTNGVEISDRAGTEALLTLPTGINNLGGNRDITVDTLVPEISSIETLKSAGVYKAGVEILFKLLFSEEMVISTQGAEPWINLNNGGMASFAGQLDSQSLLFRYTIADGEDSPELSLDSFQVGGYSLADQAGNSLNTSLPGGGDLSVAIQVDTQAPDAPVISVDAGTMPVYYESVTLSFTGINREYSLDGGSSWTSGSSLSLNNSGSYTVYARQCDAAGNYSSSSSISLDLELSDLISYVTAVQGDGLYVSGDIDIELHFRKTVTLANGTPILELNGDNGSGQNLQASYLSGSGSSTLVFRYTIGSSDSADPLNYLSTGSLDLSSSDIQDSNNTLLDDYISLPDPGGNYSLSGSRNIQIIAGLPQLQSQNFSGTTLTLIFSTNVYKNTGDITAIQQNPQAPILLEEEDFDEWQSRLQSFDTANGTNHEANLLNSYFWGTYGGDFSSGTYEADLTGKYILNFDLESDDNDLLDALVAAQLDRIIMPVDSSLVSGAGTSTINVDFSGAYQLPVMGAIYDVVLPSGIFSDAKAQNFEGSTGDITMEPTGVETPIIRVQKQSETLAYGGGLTAIQPATTQVKLDCLTPGSTVYYTISQAATDASGATQGDFVTEPADPSNASSSGTFTVPTVVISDDQGYKSWIKAKAFKGAEESSVAQEAALRTVVCYSGYGQFSDIANATLYPSQGESYPDNGDSMFWVRGGSDRSGTTVIPGYPLSWDDSMLDKIRLTTGDGTTVRWMTWEIVTNGYAKMVWGTLPESLAEGGNGPWQYGWWTPNGEYFDPLFAGECRFYNYDGGDSIEGVDGGYGNLHPRYGYSY